jgi:hypothetical protein
LCGDGGGDEGISVCSSLGSSGVVIAAHGFSKRWWTCPAPDAAAGCTRATDWHADLSIGAKISVSAMRSSEHTALGGVEFEPADDTADPLWLGPCLDRRGCSPHWTRRHE